MLYTTSAIVIHHFNYSESSIIAKLYTHQFGMQSFIIKSARKPNSKIKPALLQPLSIVEIEAYRNNKTTLQNLKQIKSIYNPGIFEFNIYKSSITLFLSEIIYKSIHHEEPNVDLFDFFHKSIISLHTNNINMDFHLKFLINFSAYLGFYPNDNYSLSRPFFNLVEGRFESFYSDEKTCLDTEMSLLFHHLLTSDEDTSVTDSNITRRFLLSKILDYYGLHIHNFPAIKSHKVLEEILK